MRRCKQCGGLMEHKKASAVFCRDNCRVNYFKRKQRILDEMGDIYLSIWSDKQTLEYLKLNLSTGKTFLKEQIAKIQNKVLHIKEQINTYKHELTFSPYEFRKYYYKKIQKEPVKYKDFLHIVDFPYYPEERKRLLNQMRFIVKDNIKTCLGKLKYQQRQLANKKSELRLFSEDDIKKRINRMNNQIKEYAKKFKALKSIDLDNLEMQPRPAKPGNTKKMIAQKSTPSFVGSYSAAEIMKMKFPGTWLDGELGKFLGKLVRVQCAIALTGDSGAGKTTFSYQLANAFLDKGMRVGYFSLESGFTEKMQELLEYYEMDKKKFEAYDTATLEDVLEKSGKYDCVIIDSFKSISSNNKDFERLRKAFPKVYFIVIFQKNAKGTIKGGTDIKFDCSAKIDIKLTKKRHRIAFMEKSRFDAENFVFSIDNNKLLKGNKDTIFWDDIEKNWPLP